MDANKMREQFEAKFETPHGVFWCGARRRYLTITAHVACVQYQGRWEGWQASREAVVVAAPAWPDHYDYTNSDVAGAAIVDCRVAFQKSMRAQGLKVEVKP